MMAKNKSFFSRPRQTESTQIPNNYLPELSFLRACFLHFFKHNLLCIELEQLSISHQTLFSNNSAHSLKNNFSLLSWIFSCSFLGNLSAMMGVSDSPIDRRPSKEEEFPFRLHQGRKKERTLFSSFYVYTHRYIAGGM